MTVKFKNHTSMNHTFFMVISSVLTAMARWLSPVIFGIPILLRDNKNITQVLRWIIIWNEIITKYVVKEIKLDRQISLVGAVLQTFSQIRALSKIFFRGCCFWTYPACKSQLGVTTSCMADTWRRLEGRANTVGDFSPREVGNASTVGATLEAPVLLAISA